LFRLTNKGLAFGLEELTSEVGKPLSEIEPEAYRILRTYGLTIRDVDGNKRIQGWENKRFQKLYIERNRDRVLLRAPREHPKN